ncbi:hypothetical protein R5W23_001353 [Gemmata sp. JC673]|uniref:Uncharacterized protein n=1 Tax=Gemmata algarum TaxID=2975278 RepID=A0ABU5F1Y2_9BACT|nr:hypothetical protein [Gemmata algarum]MDY3560128.1 hypothetical protein [Gemmata algarum]
MGIAKAVFDRIDRMNRMKTDRFQILLILSILSKTAFTRVRPRPGRKKPPALVHVTGGRVAVLDEPQPPGSGVRTREGAKAVFDRINRMNRMKTDRF